MANTAPTATGAPGVPRRGLWQAPLFLVGVGALVAVAAARPTLPRVACGLHGDLAEARRLLEHRDPDLARAARLAERVLERADAAPAVAAEARFLLGSCLLRQAEHNQSADDWAAARRHLEVADLLGVADGDAPFLQYRLGKVLFHSGDDPRKVVARVRPAAELLPRDGPDLIDAYALLTDAYRRLGSEDDLREALAYNKKLRDLKQAAEDVLPRARLIGGEIQLRLKDAEGARKSLERVYKDPEASPEAQAQAMLLIARSFEGEGHWPEAAELWQKALPDAKKPAVVLYHLGVCAANESHIAEAVQHWERCVQLGGCEEAQAAAVALADLRLKGDSPETALEMLTLAVADIKGPDDWRNSPIDVAAVRKAFADAVQTFAKAGKHDLILKLADPFAKLADASQVASLKATAAAAWGRKRLEQAKQASPEARKDEEAAARDLLRQAAAAFAEAAAASATAEKAENLWQSAMLSREAGDVAPTAEKLDRYLREPNLPDERLGEGWYWLGEAQRLMNEPDAAMKAYLESVKYQTRFAYLSRYQWAVAQAAKGSIDDAASALTMNLEKLSITVDDEAKEKSLYALGDLEFRRGRYAEVVRRLGDAVELFKDNPGRTRARFQLASSYRRLADQTSLKSPVGDDLKDPAAREAKKSEHGRHLAAAADGFLTLAHFLLTDEAKGHLTPEEEVEVPFLAAESLLDHGDYTEALQVYEHLYGRFPGRPEGLNALGGMVRCYGMLNDKDEGKRRLDEIEVLLKTISDEMLPQAARQQWTKWVAEVRKAPGMTATP
jgi:TolA-binding protein